MYFRHLNVARVLQGIFDIGVLIKYHKIKYLKVPYPYFRILTAVKFIRRPGLFEELSIVPVPYYAGCGDGACMTTTIAPIDSCLP